MAAQKVNVAVYREDGKPTGQVHEFGVDVGEAGVSHRLIHDVVCMYRSNLRLGTAKTKSRAEVVGSSKKLFKQKGTGNARMGNKRQPVRRGGGHCFAKRPRDWHYRLPAKMLRKATREVLGQRLLDGRVMAVESLDMSVPSTSRIAKMLVNLGASGGRALIATKLHSEVIYKSARNIPTCSVDRLADVNCYKLLLASRIVVMADAIEDLKSMVGVA